jgi:hypothetical protein
MSIKFPTELDDFSDPVGSSSMEDSHPELHKNVNDAIEALEAKVGVTDSVDTNSLDYKINHITGSGDVVGPSSATDGNVVLFDTATGKKIKDSGLTLSGTNTGDNATNTQYSGLATSKQDALNGTGFVKAAGTTISYDNSTYLTSVEGTAIKSTGETGGTKFLREDGDGTCSWQTVAGTGDMVLATEQSVTGLKTFDKDKIAMKGTSTGVTTVSTANTGASNYTITLPAETGTLLTSGGALGTPSSGTLTNCTGYPAASTTAAGISELAIASEVNTGTSDTLSVTPDALAGSVMGTKGFCVIAVAPTTDVSAADGKAYIMIPECMNGMNLVRANASVVTAGTTNATTIDIYNVTDSKDMLSTAISIASGGTIGTAGTVNASYDDVATNDVLRIDVTSASTTNAKGLQIILEFRLA